MRDLEALGFRQRNLEVLYKPSEKSRRGYGERVNVVHVSLGTGRSVHIEFSDGKREWVSASDLHDPNRVV